jgi:hypothetical protein
LNVTGGGASETIVGEVSELGFSVHPTAAKSPSPTIQNAATR